MSHLRVSQADQQNLSSPAQNYSEVPPRLFFWVLVFVLGLLHVWAHRNDVSPDSISYIEIAWNAVRIGLHGLVNAYWSPLYPFLLSLVFRFFHPSPQWEFTAAHLLNFAVYLANLASFELFLKELILVRQAAGQSSQESLPISLRTIWIWGYVFFLWASYFWLGPAWVTPDLCVAALAFLAAALLLRIRRGRGNWLTFVVLGALLGLGYLTKAAIFPLSFVFLFSAFCLSRSAKASFGAAALRALLAAGVFAAFALPFILSLSALKGRLTFGDAGRINYVEFVNRATRSVHWQGSPPGTGAPIHPTRKISSDPDVFEFSSPVPGSYPPWYDPSYWYDGARPHFSLGDQSRALFRAANMYLKIFSKSGVLWLVLVTLFVFRKKVWAWASAAPGEWLVILPLVAPLAMYSLVLVEFRYVAPFTLMLLLWVLSRLRIVSGAEPASLQRFHRIMLLAPALIITWAAARDLYDALENKPYEPWLVARQLHTLGIAPGTGVGYIGTGLDAYWAHLAGIRIIVEIPDEQQSRFIAADPARRQQVLTLFSSVGTKAVLTRNAAAANLREGWRPIPGTHHFIWKEPLLVAEPDKK